MSKLQSTLALLIFIILMFSMDMIFGNPLRETFRGGGGGGGKEFQPGRGLLLANRFNNTPGLTSPDVPPFYFEQSDDEPLFFNRFRLI